MNVFNNFLYRRHSFYIKRKKYPKSIRSKWKLSMTETNVQTSRPVFKILKVLVFGSKNEITSQRSGVKKSKVETVFYVLELV